MSRLDDVVQTATEMIEKSYEQQIARLKETEKGYEMEVAALKTEIARLMTERDAAVARAEAAEKERGADTGYDCTICGFRIYGAMRGNGDGTGNRFAHDACWWRKEAEDLASRIKAGTETTP